RDFLAPPLHGSAPQVGIPGPRWRLPRWSLLRSGLSWACRSTCAPAAARGPADRAAAGWGALDGASPARGAPIEAAGGAAARQGGLTSQARAKLRALSAEYPQERSWTRRPAGGTALAASARAVTARSTRASSATAPRSRSRPLTWRRCCGTASAPRTPRLRLRAGGAHAEQVSAPEPCDPSGLGPAGHDADLVYEYLPGGDLFQRLYKSKLARGARTFFWHERL
ncbi:unnamed protein product, partial [Prorocentrum cordatum]